MRLEERAIFSSSESLSSSVVGQSLAFFPAFGFLSGLAFALLCFAFLVRPLGRGSLAEEFSSSLESSSESISACRGEGGQQSMDISEIVCDTVNIGSDLLASAIIEARDGEKGFIGKLTVALSPPPMLSSSSS